VDVLTQAVQFGELTDGAFDVTIKPLVELYRSSQQGLPEASQILAAARLVDYTQLQISSDLVEFSTPGMQITLDGIAKGYIVDQGTAELRTLGYQNVLVEAGGDLLAAGQKAADAPWKIGIQSPRSARPGLLAKVALSDQAAATSGDYMNAFTEDLDHHHIIDPRTGVSSPELASVTVVGKTAMQADALATALMVLGVSDGLALIETLPGVEAYLVMKDLTTSQTSGF
jgi:thiamine biosynthesis lipoprotein